MYSMYKLKRDSIKNRKQNRLVTDINTEIVINSIHSNK